MAAPNEKLAASLTVLRDLQKDGRRVFQSQGLSRLHRERLLQNGFLPVSYTHLLSRDRQGAVASNDSSDFQSRTLDRYA